MLNFGREARLWYELLRFIANDWPSLQENSRQQYSKIGNTKEQLFHAWRSFHYDEDVETIDVYVNRIRQVAAMLGYGELQILEVFKNTIPNTLHWILYPIDNMRVAVETAKRVLTKEKIDRQMSGQSSTMPFMRMNNENNYPTKGSCKKGITFDALETIEKNNDCIDKLTSLVSKMNMKIYKHEAQYKPQVYQGRRKDKIDIKIDKTIINPEIGHTVGIKLCPIEAEEIRIGTIDQIIEVDHEITIDMTIGETTIDMMIGEITTDKLIDVTLIDKIIEEIITEPTVDQIIEETIIGNRDTELEVKAWTILEIITEIIQGKGLNKIEI